MLRGYEMRNAPNSPHLYILISTTLAVALLAGPALADVLQNESIYSGGGQVYLPKIAVDPDSGTMLVVFTVKPVAGKEQSVHFRRVTLSGEALNVRQLTTVSNGGDEGNVTFNESTSQFYVVWDDMPRKSFETSAIRGQHFDLEGNSSGNEITYPVFSSANLHPLAIYNQQTGGYMVVWQRWAIFETRKISAGLFAVPAGADGMPEQTPVKIRDGAFDGDVNLSYYPMAGAFNVKKKTFMAALCETSDDNGDTDARQYFIYHIDTDGSLNRRLNFSPLESDSLSWYAGLSESTKRPSKFHMAAWAADDTLATRRVNKKGKLKRGRTYDYANVDYATIAYNPVKNRYQVVFETDEGLFAGYIKPNGKFKGDLITLTTDNTVDKAVAAWNARLGQFVVVYVIDGGQDDELRMVRLPATP